MISVNKVLCLQNVSPAEQSVTVMNTWPRSGQPPTHVLPPWWCAPGWGWSQSSSTLARCHVVSCHNICTLTLLLSDKAENFTIFKFYLAHQAWKCWFAIILWSFPLVTTKQFRYGLSMRCNSLTMREQSRQCVTLLMATVDRMRAELSSATVTWSAPLMSLWPFQVFSLGGHHSSLTTLILFVTPQ